MAIESQEPKKGIVELAPLPKSSISYSFAEELRREINNRMDNVVNKTWFQAKYANRHGNGDTFTSESVIYLGPNRFKNVGWSSKEKGSVGIRILSTSPKANPDFAEVRVSVFDLGIENAIGRSLNDLTIFESSFNRGRTTVQLYSGNQYLRTYPYNTEGMMMRAINDLIEARRDRELMEGGDSNGH